MRLIPITEYDDRTMQLAKPVYDSQRRMLLSANQTIHPKYLERLVQIGIKNLIVEDAESKGITLEEMIDIPSWMDIVQSVQEAFNAVKLKKQMPTIKLLQGTGRLIQEIKSRSLVLPVPSTTLAVELKPYAHAVNVAILSLQVGKILGYNELMLRDLALGCLLHDIGKAVNSVGREHPEAGFTVLRSIREISLLSAHIAYQHHETLDGQGYPRSISGEAFHPYAQICGVCNVYENQTGDTPPHDAMEMVMALSSISYNVEVIQAFVRAVPAYSPGTIILLQGGEEAIVTKITSHMQRPVVRILATGEEISLADHPTIMISGCK
ncbi:MULTISPECIES: HD domain-containing phosphohydrolase [unclassified Paenibacillus]|uniref:HD-GYP domain-containing protein n=1 Tax=unclassified Paenibacillus TaxID=185978 RepID=UPI001AEA82E5|nr:putative nucleotidyltransferase with HDIG domain [Paenibacillus sp. PvP091]MBP1169667.1 putative nucleotidyltransferase with HDIG domain [Paenibacillus sp. PvR098]MBP2440695.1 putative nucleotidyltransferase with HDIG domain [Paenibacillus sp. PvP052]